MTPPRLAALALIRQLRADPAVLALPVRVRNPRIRLAGRTVEYILSGSRYIDKTRDN